MGKACSTGADEGGFSLLELLAVLAILAILAAVGVNSLGSKSPRATRAGLMEVRGLFTQARGFAIAYGSPVMMQTDLATWRVQFKPLDAANQIQRSGGQDIILGEVTLDDSWRRYADPAAAVPADAAAPTPDGVAAITSLLGAATSAATADFYDPANKVYVFGTNGNPMLLSGGTLTALVNGTWATVVGRTPNASGVPYGVVTVAPTGHVSAFFKPDAQLNQPAEYQWKRLD
jgi:prepilin-type N-terminal cleavage/methylation domain-containing protein